MTTTADRPTTDHPTPAPQPAGRRRPSTVRIVGLALLLLLLVAMLLNTKFLTPAKYAAALPKQFNAKASAADLFAKAQKEIPGSAAPLGDVVTAIQSDPKAAAATFKASSVNENAFVFRVRATGTVVDASAESLQLKVAGVPAETTVIVPLKTAVNGTVLRDGMGFKFADAPDQTSYQNVGDELKKLILAQVVSGLADPTALKGKQVEVIGVTGLQYTGAPPPAAKPVNIQPISVKASS